MAIRSHTQFARGESAGMTTASRGRFFNYWLEDSKTLLLWCGMLASVFYVFINIFVAILAEGYSMKSQTVSELSAIDSPTRPLWIALIVPYGLLMMVFGWGVFRAAGNNRSLRAVGVLFVANSIIGFMWPPMHLRGVETSLTDTLHIAFTFVTVAIFVLQIVFASLSLRGAFAVYSIMSAVVMIAFGVLTGLEAPGIPADLPTPMIGVWERISIGAYVLWVSVFAWVLLLKRDVASESDRKGKATKSLTPAFK